MKDYLKQILIGLGIAVTSAMTLGAKSLYDEVKLNTGHRVDSQKVFEMIQRTHDTVIRLETNQKILMKELDK